MPVSCVLKNQQHPLAGYFFGTACTLNVNKYFEQLKQKNRTRDKTVTIFSNNKIYINLIVIIIIKHI